MIILGTNSIKDTGYDVANSLRFNDGSSDSLNRTLSSASNRKTFTVSLWCKRSALGITTSLIGADSGGGTNFGLQLQTNDTLAVFQGASTFLHTTQVFRDVSAWSNFVLAVDTTNGTADNRIRLYHNGSEITSFGTRNNPSVNTDLAWNNNVDNTVGADKPTSGLRNFFDGYLAEVVNIDGSQLAPDQFGEFDDSGIWKPKNVSGLTFGTNGFYLDFEDSSALGNDAAGSNNFTVNNLTAIDQSISTPTNIFATWNSLQPTNATMSEGNLVGASSPSSGHYSGISSIGVSSGKWYFECKQIQESTSNEGMIGVIIIYDTITALLNPVGRGGGWGLQDGTRGFSTDSSGNGSTTDSFHAGWDNNDTIGIALDIDNSRVYFSKNGSWNDSGSWSASTPTTSQTLQNGLGDGTYFFMAGDASGSNNNTWSANFGSPAHAISSGNTDADGYGNFEYSVPSGYFSLNTKNLAEYG